MNTKAMSIRLTEEDAADLAVVARADKMPKSEVIRLAVRQYIAARCEDENFQKRLKRSLDEDSKAVKRLALK